MKEIFHVSDYEERRRREYPPLIDQVEALMKGGKDLDDMRKKVRAVRDRHPKHGKGNSG